MNLNNNVEHTLLSTSATAAEIENLCKEAVSHQFRSVCVAPFFAKQARSILEDSDQKVITVVDFPLGYSHTFSKTESIKKAADLGAHGVDVVINYTAAINEAWHMVEDDIETVVHKARMCDLEIKLIIELGAYSSQVLKQVVELCKKAKPDFVKTNTGLLGNVVTKDHLLLLSRLLDGEIPIKASGGIRTREDAEEMIKAGATLLGASSALNW